MTKTMTYDDYLAIRPDYGWTEAQIQQLNGGLRTPTEQNAKEQRMAWKFRQGQKCQPKPERHGGDSWKRTAHWGFSTDWLTYWHALTVRLLMPWTYEPEGEPVDLASLRFVTYDDQGTAGCSPHSPHRWSEYAEHQLGFSLERDHL